MVSQRNRSGESCLDPGYGKASRCWRHSDCWLLEAITSRLNADGSGLRPRGRRRYTLQCDRRGFPTRRWSRSRGLLGSLDMVFGGNVELTALFHSKVLAISK